MAKAEATMLVNELSGEYYSDFIGIDTYCKENYSN